MRGVSSYNKNGTEEGGLKYLLSKEKAQELSEDIMDYLAKNIGPAYCPEDKILKIWADHIIILCINALHEQELEIPKYIKEILDA